MNETTNTMYTVKQLADLAGVSVRTLHYYDEIGLLEPSYVGENGYRYYEDAALFRLQQILLYRELDLSLAEIREILDAPDFDLVSALQGHRAALEARIHRLKGLIRTIDMTIANVTGGVEMSKKKLFTGFTEEEEKRYAQEARERWGAENVDLSYQRWKSYSPEQRKQILAEGGANYQALADLIGEDPASEEVQQVIGRWHQHLRYFYEPTIDLLRGLGNLYNDDPDFNRTISQFHPDLPAFMREAINIYCDRLEAEQQT